MSITINADVVDLRRDAPLPDERFLIDTNVWFWYAYPGSQFGGTSAMPYQLREYPKYVSSILKQKAHLFYSWVSLAEIADLIEWEECRIYLKREARERIANQERKAYRSNLTERSHVIETLEETWERIQLVARPLDSQLNTEMASRILANLPKVLLGGYDLFIRDVMHQSGITNIITDDGDFTTVTGIRVFTANKHVIENARSQQKLIVR